MNQNKSRQYPKPTDIPKYRNMSQSVPIKSGTISELLKDYDLAYKNIDSDNVSSLLSYKSDYLSNVNTLLSESSDQDNDVELLRELLNPRFVDGILEQYHLYFANVKFVYLEQSTKEKFLRNIMSLKVVTREEFENIKTETAAAKEALRKRKAERDELQEQITNQIQRNYKCFESISLLQDETKSVIERSKNLLNRIDQLEKDNAEQFEAASGALKEDNRLIESLLALDDLGDVLRQTQEDLLVFEEKQRKLMEAADKGVSMESSIVSNFEDYVMVNSARNLEALVRKRRLAGENMVAEQEKTKKNIDDQKEVLTQLSDRHQELMLKIDQIKKEIQDANRQNELLSKPGGEAFEELKKISEWLTECKAFLDMMKDYEAKGECKLVHGEKDGLYVIGWGDDTESRS